MIGLSVLIVNWNGSRYLYGCLDSLRATITMPFEVIVVDNNSSDGSPEAVAERYPWVKLVRSDKNLGFGRANNLAARHATGDVLLLLNYDTVVLTDPAPMAKTLRDDASIGCLGAGMCNGDGTIVKNCGHFPTPLRLLLFSSQFWRPYRGPHGPAELQAQRVDWVEGSWLLLRRETWDRVGGFDPRIFMYGEDVELSRRIADLGLHVLHTPVLAYRHYVGWSVRRLPYQYAGYRLFHRKHSGPLRRALAEGILYLGLKVRLVAYGLLAMLTRSPSFREKTSVLRAIDREWARSGEPGAREQA